LSFDFVFNDQHNRRIK